MASAEIQRLQLIADDVDVLTNAKDGATNALNTVDYAHHEIHAGSHYYLQGHVTLGNAGVLRIKLVTPDTAKWAHFTFSITSSGICATTFDEGATGGMTGGADMPPKNNNRNSTKTSDVTLTSGVTAASSYDIRLEDDEWGASGFLSTTGGGTAREDEIILKQNTTYLRTITSGSASNIVQFRASWYEHTSKG